MKETKTLPVFVQIRFVHFMCNFGNKCDVSYAHSLADNVIGLYNIIMPV